MSIIQRIKSVLGLNGSGHTDEDGPVAVTVEHDPEPEPDPATGDEHEPAEAERTDTELTDVEEDEAETEDTSTHPGPVTEISGIGPSYSDRLADAGIITVGELANADAATIANETDLSEKRIAGWIESAEELASGN